MKYLFLVIALFIGPVCMAHSDENFIKSDEFRNGIYKNKTIVIHSKQKGTESISVPLMTIPGF